MSWTRTGSIIRSPKCSDLLALVVALLLVSAAAAIAKPYILKCTTDTGEQAADLTVDFDQMVMTWGMAVPNYIIDKITDRYITGLQKEDVFTTDVGKRVFVLDRVTGEYKRTDVGLIAKTQAVGMATRYCALSHTPENVCGRCFK